MLKPIMLGALTLGALFVGSQATVLSLADGRKSATDDATPLQVGTNVDPISYWSTAVPFLDLMKGSRNWLVQRPGTWDTKEAVSSDEFGWIHRIPSSSDEQVTTLGLIVLRDAGVAAPPRAPYVVLFDGEGSIEGMRGQGTEVVKASSGRLIVRAAAGGDVHLRVTATDPRGTGDYIRNIRIVREDRLAAFKSGQIFNPDFLKKLRGFQTIRFMNWMATNSLFRADGSRVINAQGSWNALSAGELNWADRPHVLDARWDRGVPVETMVRLSNEIGADPWFNMPVNASNEYVSSFAKYVRQHLQSERRVHVELSNEVWNWAFPQAHYAKARAEQEFGRGANWMEWYGKRTAEIGALWKQEFGEPVSGSTASGRVQVVYGTQFVNRGLETVGLETPHWRDASGKQQSAAQYFDEYAITGYYDAGMSKRENAVKVMNWWSFPDGGYVRAVEGLRENILTFNAPLYRYHAGRAKSHGLALVTYEGGFGEQTPASQHGNQRYTDFLINVQRRPEIESLELANAEAFHEAGGTLFMNFGIVGKPSKWGSWSALESIDQPESPRYRALKELIRRSFYRSGSKAKAR